PSLRASLGRVHWSVRGRTENCVPASSVQAWRPRFGNDCRRVTAILYGLAECVWSLANTGKSHFIYDFRLAEIIGSNLQPPNNNGSRRLQLIAPSPKSER